MMNKQEYVEALSKFMKSNKVRREINAKKAGFKDAASYKTHLVNEIAKASTTKKPSRKKKVSGTTSSSRKVIHNIIILDISWSMEGAKLKNAIKGINSEIAELKQDKSVDYRISIIPFATTVRKFIWNQPIKLVPVINLSTSGTTAMNQAIGETINNSFNVKGIDNTLVKIFTDGGENASKGKYRSYEAVSEVIATAEGLGTTVTFVGTQTDVDGIKRRLKVHDSNTLVHDNTGEGVERAFASMTDSTVRYSKKVLREENVLTGFYKETGKL